MENDDVLEALKLQFSFLNDRLRVYDEVIQTEAKQEKSEERLNLCNCIKHEVEEKNKLIASLKDEPIKKDKEMEEAIHEKDNQIETLNRQLEMLKLERTAEKVKPRHVHTDSISTSSSMPIFNTDELERQLVEMKFKYAEVCAKLTELEDELEKKNSQLSKLLGIVMYKNSIDKKDEFIQIIKYEEPVLIEDYIEAGDINESTLDGEVIQEHNFNKSFINKVKKFISI
jgi:hypothetical protein